MDEVMQFFGLPVVMALLWLAAALVVAAIVRAIAVGVVKRSGLRQRFARDDMAAQDGARSYQKTVDYVGKLSFLLVFLMFVPAIFTALGVENVSGPVMLMLDQVWSFIPSILAAGIILAVGMTAARLIRQLLVPLFLRIRVDRLESRAGITVKNENRLAETLASIVYVLIVIPVVITALQVLDIAAISDPATDMLNTVIGFVPNILAAGVLIALGVFIGRVAGNVVGQLLSAAGVDAQVEKLYEGKTGGMQVSRGANVAVQALIITLAVVEGLDVLQLEVLTGMGSAVVAYLPNVFAALVVFALAALASLMVGRVRADGRPMRYARPFQAALWAFAAIMVLSQLNIAPQIVQGASAIMLTSVAVAFALAFGIGGRDAAKAMMDRWVCAMPDAGDMAMPELTMEKQPEFQGAQDAVDTGVLNQAPGRNLHRDTFEVAEQVPSRVAGQTR